jgi:urease accessory protein
MILDLAHSPALPLAHGFTGGSAWLHPLTGPDHMLAMVAVGAWSAQLGRRALYLVPAGFVAAMAVGAITGFTGRTLPGSELAIAVSVLTLGLAVSLSAKIATPAAAIAVALFGFAHGYAHGTEFQRAGSHLSYLTGFCATTAALHIAGAVGTLLLPQHPRGPLHLKIAGAAAAAAGAAFLTMAIHHP